MQAASIADSRRELPDWTTRADIHQVAEGWQQSAVTSIVQSHDGYLWLGSYHGLVRFDGVRYTVFDTANTPELRNGLVTSLYEDSRGLLWIGHETGQLTRLSGSRFEAVSLGQNWPGGAVESITSDEAGDLWLLSSTGVLLRLRDGTTVDFPGGGAPGRKPAISRANNGQIWVVADGIVGLLRDGRWVPFSLKSPATGAYYERVLPAGDGGLWVVGNGRLRKWRESQWLSDQPLWPEFPGAVTTLLETRFGVLLAGSLRQGVQILQEGAPPLLFTRTNGLSHDWVRALCEDHEGNLWVGTAAGWDGLRPRKVTLLNPPDDWHGCKALSLVVEPDGSAWIGSEGAGLYHYEQGRWAHYDESAGLANLFVWSVLQTHRGDLLAGTYGGGLLLRRGDRFEVPEEIKQLASPIMALYEGRGGELWLGTKAGLYRHADHRLELIANEENLQFADVRAITEAPDGPLWFGMSGGGLGSFKNGQVRQFRKRNGLGSDFVLSLQLEPDGTLWIGTGDNGLTRFRDGQFSIIGTHQGLPTGIISHIVDDQEGNFWLGTHAGILRLSKAELNECADGLLASVHALAYGKSEGLVSETCSGGFQPGACRSADGRLWFPTSSGVAIVDPRNVTANRVPPSVVIEQLIVDGDPWPTNHSAAAVAVPVRVSPGHQQFEFHYTGLSFMAPRKVRFQYKLEGLEDRWVAAGTRRVAEYSHLVPGKYKFRVIACNNDNVWNEAGASLAFVVQPFFWETLWFQTGVICSGAGALAGGVRWATRRRLRRKFEQLEHQRGLERERARIARDIHDDLGASLTRITMLSQSVRGEVEALPEAAADVDQIYATARELTRAMDEIVWAVNPKHDTLDSLVTYLGRYAQNFLSTAGLRCRLDVPLHLPVWGLTAELRHNVFLAFKEALNNVVKHAAATQVRLSFELDSTGFALVIADNGCGFDLCTHRPTPSQDSARIAGGNGLLNMSKRLEEIGGRCEWQSAPGEGTRVKLIAPFPSSVVLSASLKNMTFPPPQYEL